MRIKLHLLLALLFFPLTAGATGTIDAVIFTKQGERPLRLELATTPEEREQGLMNRSNLAPNDGMLFVFPTANRVAFWMKDTKLPLDMLFIGPLMDIIHIEADTVPYSLTHHNSPNPTQAVIELDGGRAAKDGIAEGDMVRYALPKNISVR